MVGGLCGLANAIEYDILNPGDTHLITGDVGGTAMFEGDWNHVGGTGVFSPFMDLQAPKSGVESAYNTDFRPLVLNAHRNNWNYDLRLGDLQWVQKPDGRFFVFALDSNEQGNSSDLISVDNIRIYTSATDTGSVTDEANLASLGTLRFALNNPLKTGTPPAYNADDWIKLASGLDNAPGSGTFDLIVYIPTSAFAGAGANDYVWFYDLNGIHNKAGSGFEEWHALKGSNPQVPDGGSTVLLLGFVLSCVEGLRRKLSA